MLASGEQPAYSKSMMESAAVNNRDIPIDKPKRDEKGWLLPGHHQGRKPGSVNEITALRNTIIKTVALLDKEEEYGGNFILAFAKKFPDKFMTIVASLLPKQLKIDAEHTHKHIAIMDLPEAERARVFAECRERVLRIRGVDLIENVDSGVKKEEVEPSDHPILSPE